MRGSSVSDFFFTNNPNIIWGDGWGCGGVARGGGWGGGRAVGGGVDGWTDIQTQTDLPILGGGGGVCDWVGGPGLSDF